VLNLNFVEKRTLCVRIIQPSVGFIAVSATVTINFACLTEFWNKLSSLFVSEMGNKK
jgi:hypothetical protein